MGQPESNDVTMLLHAIGAGNKHAAEQLLPLVYDELRRLAKARMANEPADHTLQPTALVHEAYMRLLGRAEAGADPNAARKWDGRGHFFGAAAQAMRRILVERARNQARLKRGGGRERLSLSDVAPAADTGLDSADVLALDEALGRLETENPRRAQVVMLRYFAGLSVEETAAAMDLSPATIKNEWTVARAWLHREMTRDGPAPSAAGHQP